jgi:putative hemolysin
VSLQTPAAAVREGFESGRPHLRVSLARSREEVRAAQCLRHRVFIQELGARIGARRSNVERDRFDPFCEHLIVRDGATGEVIGTYRLLTPERAARLGTFIAASEFDLTPLEPLRGGLAELGRACIHPDYRSGGAIMLLWSGIAELIRAQGVRHLFGCASIGMEDGGANALAVCAAVAARHLAPIQYRVTPRLPVARSSGGCARVRIPALLKGYLRLGAWVCGEPAWDPEFNTADLLVLLSLERLDARYARHFGLSSENARTSTVAPPPAIAVA